MFKSQNIVFVFFAIILLIGQIVLIHNVMAGIIIIVGSACSLLILIKPKIIYLFLLSLLSLEGFSPLPGAEYSYPKLLGISLFFGLILRLLVKKDILPEDNTYKLFFVFFLGSLVSFAFAKDLTISLSTYFVYISLFAFFILTRYFLRSIQDIHLAMDILFFSTIAVAAITLILGVSVRNVETARISSGIGDANEFASYILALMPLALYRAILTKGIYRVLNWIYFISFMLMLVFTGSRGGIIGFLGVAGVLVLYYSFGRLKYMLVAVLVLACIGYFFIPDEYWVRASTITNEDGQDNSINTRIDNYNAAINMFIDYPLSGVGLYNFQLNSRVYGAKGGLVVHNTYLEILTGGGLLSFIPFCLILVNCWGKLRLRDRYDRLGRDLLIALKASFVSLLLTSFFFSGDHKKILWFIIALISSSYYMTVKQKGSFIGGAVQ